MAELNKGLVEFECGSGNNMSIEFPEVIEEDARMNLGVAFMPLMKDGFCFFKEDSLSPTKVAGINAVEIDFVKYLYEIREANRKNKVIEYNLLTRPDHNIGGERIFIGGKIFPFISLSTETFILGTKVNFSNIKLKKFKLKERGVGFKLSFREKNLALEYISIDNDKLQIYFPKKEMKIDYGALLLDFLKNGDKTKQVSSYGEFPDMETYTLVTDSTTLGDGCWLKSDRKGKEQVWKDACLYIVENRLQGVLAPFGQIADFYAFLDKEITNKGHKTRWLKGAKKLVSSMVYYLDDGSKFMTNDVETILNELNLGICDYAITQFYRVLYGEFKDDILDTNEKAYDFDLAFVIHEQGTVAVPIYDKAKNNTIEKYQNMADQDPADWGGFSLHGIVGFGNESVLRNKIIPPFDDWNGKVTDFQFRIDLPMFMLWLDRHKTEHESFKGKIDEKGHLLPEYKDKLREYAVKVK